MQGQSANLPEPPGRRSFKRMFPRLNAFNNLEDIKLMSLFICGAPLFHNDSLREEFLDTVEKFSLLDLNGFTNSLKDSHHQARSLSMADVGGWDKRVSRLGTGHPLRKVMYHSGGSFPGGFNPIYENSGGIYWLVRCAVHHPGDWVSFNS